MRQNVTRLDKKGQKTTKCKKSKKVLKMANYVKKMAISVKKMAIFGVFCVKKQFFAKSGQ